MTAYIALLRKERDSDFGVNFPDFPGCVTAGKSLEDARRMADEAIGLHVRGMIEDREPIPKPSSLDAIMDDADNRDAVAFLVEISSKPAKAVRINVMLPQDIVEAIDRTTNNRSRFLADAARERLREDLVDSRDNARAMRAVGSGNMSLIAEEDMDAYLAADLVRAGKSN
jgi:predicted RNase H-like HicB family nuclease